MEHVRMLLSGNGNPRRSLLGIGINTVGCAARGMYSVFLTPPACTDRRFSVRAFQKRTCFQSLHVPKSIAQPSVFVKRIFHFTGKTI